MSDVTSRLEIRGGLPPTDQLVERLHQPGISYRIVKRLIDVFVAVAALIVLSPLLLLAAILIKLESKGPAYFSQERSGKDGRIINVLKLRTMWAVEAGHTRAQPGDARVTRVGRVLRRWTIDELPQLINVVKGEMSLVGPRPLPVAEQEQLLEELQARRLPIPDGLIPTVTPGMIPFANQLAAIGQTRSAAGTGAMAAIVYVSPAGHKLSYAERFRLNAEYERHRSLRLDLKVLLLWASSPLRGFVRVVRRVVSKRRLRA